MSDTVAIAAASREKRAVVFARRRRQPVAPTTTVAVPSIIPATSDPAAANPGIAPPPASVAGPEKPLGGGTSSSGGGGGGPAVKLEGSLFAGLARRARADPPQTEGRLVPFAQTVIGLQVKSEPGSASASKNAGEDDDTDDEVKIVAGPVQLARANQVCCEFKDAQKKAKEHKRANSEVYKVASEMRRETKALRVRLTDMVAALPDGTLPGESWTATIETKTSKATTATQIDVLSGVTEILQSERLRGRFLDPSAATQSEADFMIGGQEAARVARAAVLAVFQSLPSYESTRLKVVKTRSRTKRSSADLVCVPGRSTANDSGRPTARRRFSRS
jgi:hypothetical protein